MAALSRGMMNERALVAQIESCNVGQELELRVAVTLLHINLHI